MIDEADLRILTVLGKVPLGTVQEIASSTHMTSATVSNRIKNLKASGYLTHVTAQIHYPSLGLEPYFVFIEAPYRALEKIERLLDLHPYTRYRIRCVGYFNGLYCIFAVPQGSLGYLSDFFGGLKGRLVDNYWMEEAGRAWSYSESDFTGFDIHGRIWEFDWGAWEKSLDSIPVVPSVMDDRKSVLRRMDSKDMRILRELTIDARRPGKRVAAEAKVTTYHLTRRLQLYDKLGLIDAYRVLAIKVSNLLATFTFVCECDEHVTRLFSSAFRLLPFQTTVYPVRKGFVVQFNVPPEDLATLGSILQKRCDAVRSLWSDYRNSMRYWFWGEPFKDGAWAATRERMVDEVLAKGDQQ